MFNTQTNLIQDGEPSDLFVALDRSEPRRLRAQLEHSLRAAVQSGQIAAGTVLPPSRRLAQELAVARSVVVEAYGQLVAEGYLEARQGARTRVAPHANARAAGGDGSPTAGIRTQVLSGLPDPASFPRREWLRHYRAVVSEYPDASFGYPEPQGEAELRRALASYLGRVRAVRTRPEQILVGGGFAQGLSVICRVLRLRGMSQLAVEEPCFSFHRRIITAAGLEPVPIAVDQAGLEVAQLGLTRAHAVLRYDRTPVGAIQGLAPEHVIYGGSASKMLSPALRLGWLAIPSRLLDEIRRAKFVDDLASEAFGQLAFARFIDCGALSAHLRRVRPRYRARRDRLIEALTRHMPDAIPAGVAAGLHLFVWLPPDVSEDELVRQARAAAIPIEGAARHWADPRYAPPAILIGYGALHEDTIDRMITALAALVSAARE